MQKLQYSFGLSAIAWTAAICCAPVQVASGADVADADVLAISQKHCVPCHAREPVHAAFDKPQGGIVLETIEELRRHADKVGEQVIESRNMPLGNQTGMTEAERDALARWMAALK
jgi:uncharacterized membrane protein